MVVPLNDPHSTPVENLDKAEHLLSTTTEQEAYDILTAAKARVQFFEGERLKEKVGAFADSVEKMAKDLFEQ